MGIIETLKKLILTPGPPGFEDKVRDIIIEEIKDIADEMEIDSLGNLIAVLKGDPNGPKLMIDAHMDEVSMIVINVNAKGWVFFQRHGGVHQWTLLGQHVTIHTRKGPVHGVIGVKGSHLLTRTLEELRRYPVIGKMWIDIGAGSEEEASDLGVRVGDPITFYKRFEMIGKDDLFCGTSLDDRIGCIILIELMKRLSENRPEATIYAVGSVMEEVGLRGARTAAYSVNPDIALVADTTYAQDPATPEADVRLKIGMGPAIRAMERGHFVQPKIFDLIISVAEDEGIPYQLDTAWFTGTNASGIHLARGGIPTGGILVARRYSHSPVELGSIKDIENAIKLFYATTLRIDNEFVSGFKRKIK